MSWKPTDHPDVKAKNITDVVEAQRFLGEKLKQDYKIHGSDYMTSCYTCHR